MWLPVTLITPITSPAALRVVELPKLSQTALRPLLQVTEVIEITGNHSDNLYGLVLTSNRKAQRRKDMAGRVDGTRTCTTLASSRIGGTASLVADQSGQPVFAVSS
jgi:hypothetical protein